MTQNSGYYSYRFNCAGCLIESYIIQIRSSALIQYTLASSARHFGLRKLTRPLCNIVDIFKSYEREKIYVTSNNLIPRTLI
jgi:hypothetical protein